MVEIPASRTEAIAWYSDRLEKASSQGPEVLTAAERWLAQNDLFFLLVYVLKRKDLNRDWLFDRCREVQYQPDGFLDLWSREHYKSTIITFGLTLQNLLNDANKTVGIFSHTRPIAKAFLRNIKQELETNVDLVRLFPDICWQNPASQSPKWSEDDGIVLKRTANKREASVEAWGLVDGQPVGKHFDLLVFDDVVTPASVNTPEMIKKTTDSWALALNLGADGGSRRVIGTPYAFNDTYFEMMERGAVKVRRHPATDDGTFDGNPVLWSRETLRQKRTDMGPYVASCFPGEAPILMADWNEKPISSIKPGEYVVGWTMEDGRKSRLVPSLVKNVQITQKPVCVYGTASGRRIRCTPDHKWYTGRRETDGQHNSYIPLGTMPHKNNIKSLISIAEPVDECPDPIAAAYIAGIFDGEGHASGNTIAITQDEKRNPEVCVTIREALFALGFDFSEDRPQSRKNIITFRIKGGRQAKIKFLRWCGKGKAHKIANILFRHCSRDFGKAHRDAVEWWPGDFTETETVWNIETETGNFVAYGYATKNSQLLLDPVADQAQGFKKEWLGFWEALNTQGMNLYMVCDPASSKKASADYTFMAVIGIGEDDHYRVVDMIRDRLNLTERADQLFQWHRQYKPLGVAYEEYGMQADIDHYQERMKRENYRFHITKVGGRMKKEERIRRLIPLFEQNRFLLPEVCWHTNCEGVHEDLTKIFVNQEYLPFPVGHHDDMLDGLSRIFDIRTQKPESRQTRAAGKPDRTAGGLKRARR